MIPPKYLHIIKLAIPIILANASVPLLGLADTAAIGRTGNATDLGAIALATLIFNFVYWGFGFLRMGTTGFVSQAVGAGDIEERDSLIFRALFLGGLIGICLIILQPLIGEIAIHFLQGSDSIKNLVREYFYIRIWGAPATLITFGLLGTFIGAGWTKHLMYVQFFLNGLNIALNILLVVFLDWGVKGIAAGTLIAEWITVFFAIALLKNKISIEKPKERYLHLKKQIFDKVKMKAIFQVNRDIMIRTFALLAGFAWFANQGAKFGDSVLASNHVLLQFVSLSAFFLDGFAHVAEMLSGKAFGAKNRNSFVTSIKESSIIAGITALVLSILIWLFSEFWIPLLTQDVEVQKLAIQHSVFAAIYIAFSFAAFQLDGIFIGITKSKEMRNSTLFALFTFLIFSYLLIPYYGNIGLWISFIIYVISRGLFLGYYYKKVLENFNHSIN